MSTDIFEGQSVNSFVLGDLDTRVTALETLIDTLFSADIFTFEWTAGTNDTKTTGPLGYTPIIAVGIFYMPVGNDNFAFSVGFATSASLATSVGFFETGIAGDFNHSSDPDAIGGVSRANTGSNDLDTEIDVTAFAESGVSVKPDQTETNTMRLFLLVAGQNTLP